jgi:hypothetical protein
MGKVTSYEAQPSRNQDTLIGSALDLVLLHLLSPISSGFS